MSYVEEDTYSETVCLVAVTSNIFIYIFTHTHTHSERERERERERPFLQLRQCA
jgi:hypothetical protein